MVTMVILLPFSTDENSTLYICYFYGLVIILNVNLINVLIIHLFNKMGIFCPKMGFFFSLFFGNKRSLTILGYTFFAFIFLFCQSGIFWDFLLPSNDNEKIPLNSTKSVQIFSQSQKFFFHMFFFLHYALKSFCTFFLQKLFLIFPFWTFFFCPFCKFWKKFSLKKCTQNSSFF